MNPDSQPHRLTPERVEWVPSSPDAIELRVFGTWHGPTVPPSAALVVAEQRIDAQPAPPRADVPPQWSAAFLVPIQARAAVEQGTLVLVVDGEEVALPPAAPGRMAAPEVLGGGGTLVDPAVLAERRARRAELAEQSAAQRAASAEQAADTLRAQLENLEERLERAADERDGLAARVADAERRLRLAEQREEAERRRRGELEDEAVGARREAEADLRELRDRLSSAEEVADALERQLAQARRRAHGERAARERVEAQLRTALEQVSALEGTAGDESEALRRRAEALTAQLAEAEADRDRLEAARGPVDELDAVRAELVELRLRLAAAESALAGERDARASSEARADEERRAREIADRRLAEERMAREEAERRAAQAPPEAGEGVRERRLAGQVATLEAELARRVETHERVQSAIEAVRRELVQVRAEVDAGRAGTAARAELDALEHRRREVQARLAEREAELASTREALTDAQASAEAAGKTAGELRARLSDAEHRRLAGEQVLRTDFEQRIRELTDEVAQMRRRLEATTTDFEGRLASERAAREAAEAALAALSTRSAPPAPAPSVERAAPAVREDDPQPEGSGDRALDALIAGLRSQVDAAREQLEAWDREDDPDASGGEPAATAAQPDEETRRRLAAIEADIRAAVPDAASAAPARDIIASLQSAADRLRAAAEDELARTGDDADADETEPVEPVERVEPAAVAVAAETEAETEAEPEPPFALSGGPEAMPLGPRDVDLGARETPWLRTALQRLAARDPQRAADLAFAILPAQAAAGAHFSYLLGAPILGDVLVTVRPGAVDVVRGPGLADVRITGSLAALAPLVAGGAGWRLRGVHVEGVRRYARRLVRARRRPLGLGDLAALDLDPAFMLRALVAGVDEAWTVGHRFGVAYVIADRGRWTVSVEDGRLSVLDNGGEHAHAAVVELSRGALFPVLHGAPVPRSERAVVVGDGRAVDVLHGWFDRARGVAAR